MSTPPARTSNDYAAILAWHYAAGVDTIVGDVPVNRLRQPQQPRVPQQRIDGPPPPAVRTETVETGSSSIAHQSTAPAPRRLTNSTASTGAGTNATPAAAAAHLLAEAATDLASLEEAVRTFDGCPLKETAAHTVFAAGAPDARIMLIGEAPGAEEDRTGQPFVGQSGRLLDRILMAIGLGRDEVRITNTLFWRPPGNRDPTPAERAACLPFVNRHIALVRPEVLVLLGATAARTMLDRTEGISRLRGRWLNYICDDLEQPIDVLCTYHPAYLLRTPEKKREVWRDFLLLKARLGGLDTVPES